METIDILVSIDAVYLFTKAPISDAIELIRCKFGVKVSNIMELCLRSTFFSFQGVICEQVDGVAMGSPLSPIIDNMYMEHF